MQNIFKQEATGHVGVVSFLRSYDRTSVVGESYLISQLAKKMPVLREGFNVLVNE